MKFREELKQMAAKLEEKLKEWECILQMNLSVNYGLIGEEETLFVKAYTNKFDYKEVDLKYKEGVDVRQYANIVFLEVQKKDCKMYKASTLEKMIVTILEDYKPDGYFLNDDMFFGSGGILEEGVHLSDISSINYNEVDEVLELICMEDGFNDIEKYQIDLKAGYCTCVMVA